MICEEIENEKSKQTNDIHQRKACEWCNFGEKTKKTK